MEKYDKIYLYEAFNSSLKELLSSYNKEEEKLCKKATYSHRLATLLEEKLPFFVTELDYDGSDILIKDKNKAVLAVFWSQNYIGEKEQEEIKKFSQRNKVYFTVGFSLFKKRDYLLLYLFDKEKTEYHHIKKNTFEEVYLKKKSSKKENNGNLFKGKRKKI